MRRNATTLPFFRLAIGLTAATVASPAAAFDWAGFYLGLGISGLEVDFDAGSSLSGRPRGSVGTLTIGGLTTQDGVFLGLEAATTIGGTEETYFTGGGDFVTWRTDHLSFVNARLGYDFGGMVGFVTAGAAASWVFLDSSVTAAESHWRLGYAIGAGVEFSLSKTIGVETEFRFTDFGRVKLVDGRYPVDLSSHSLTTGVILHF